MCHPCPGCAPEQRAGLPITGGFSAPRTAQSTSMRFASTTQTLPKIPLSCFLPPGSFSQAMLFGKGSRACSCLMWQGHLEHGQDTAGACLGARAWQEEVKGWFKDWHCLLPPREEKEQFHTWHIPSPQQTDLSGAVTLCAAIKLHWNGKASLYKSRSKPSIFSDGGHSLI